MPEHDLAGRVALVTGGGSGIGLGIARGLAGRGAAVAVLGRREQVVQQAAEELGRAGVRALGLPCDVRDREAVDAAVERTHEQLGHVDLLVNAAAGNFRVRPEEMSPRAWDAVVRIVLDGTWNLTQAVCRPAIAAGRPVSVLNIGTVGAVVGGPHTVHSASAKAGVVAMTKSLARAWGPHGIRLNVLTPGLVLDTPGTEILNGAPEAKAARLGETPLGRLADLDDVVEPALFLLGDRARHVTGQNLIVDGGRHLGEG